MKHLLLLSIVRRSRAFPETRIIRFVAIDFTKFFVIEHGSSAEKYDATLIHLPCRNKYRVK